MTQLQLPQLNLHPEKRSKSVRVTPGHVVLAGVLGVDGAGAGAQAGGPERETGIRAQLEIATETESGTLEMGTETVIGTVIETAEKGMETGVEGAATHETVRGDSSCSSTTIT